MLEVPVITEGGVLNVNGESTLNSVLTLGERRREETICKDWKRLG